MKDSRDYDPTWHSALDGARRACIGWKWRRCEIQPRRAAIKALIAEETSEGWQRITGPMLSAKSRLRTYQWYRSGIAVAFRQAFMEGR